MKVSENQEAEAFAKWLRLKWYIFSHLANESWLPPKVAMLSAIRKKRMGVSPGVPDYMLLLKHWWLLFIELKRSRTLKKNWEQKALSSDWIEVSQEQQRWIDSLNAVDNVAAAVCFGCLDAIYFVESMDAQL